MPPRIDGSRDKVVGMVTTGWMTEKSRLDSRRRKEVYLHSKATTLAIGVTQPPNQCKSGALSPAVRMPGAIPPVPYTFMVCTRTTILYLESRLGTVGHFEARHLIFLPRILDRYRILQPQWQLVGLNSGTSHCRMWGRWRHLLWTVFLHWEASIHLNGYYQNWPSNCMNWQCGLD